MIRKAFNIRDKGLSSQLNEKKKLMGFICSFRSLVPPLPSCHTAGHYASNGRTMHLATGQSHLIKSKQFSNFLKKNS